MPKDELGIEYDEELEELLKDPASGKLKKFMDYRDQRRQREMEIEAEKVKKQTKKAWYEI